MRTAVEILERLRSERPSTSGPTLVKIPAAPEVFVRVVTQGGGPAGNSKIASMSAVGPPHPGPAGASRLRSDPYLRRCGLFNRSVHFLVMPNRNLTPDELSKANVLLSEIRNQLDTLAGGDPVLLFAYRRKISKELTYDERGKPALRKALKALLRRKQENRCATCSQPLPSRGAVLDRHEAFLGYTEDNTRLICHDCDRKIQANRGFR